MQKVREMDFDHDTRFKLRVAVTEYPNDNEFRHKNSQIRWASYTTSTSRNKFRVFFFSR